MTAQHRHHRLTRRPTTLAGWVIFFAFGFLLAAAGAALAYFLVTVVYASGSYALAQASHLTPPTNATVTENSSTSLSIHWTNAATQLATAKYEVLRTGSHVVCTNETAGPCTDSGLTPGTHYSYSVIAYLGTHWQSSAASASFTTLGVTTTSLTPGTVGVSYSDTLHATGGTTPYSWSKTSETLPPGITLTPSTGVLSGTPTTAGTYSTLVFQVKDANSVTATSGTFSISISKATAATTTSLSENHPTRTYGAETTETFTATVTGQTNDGYPVGTVAIKTGSTTIGTATLTTSSGKTSTYKYSLTASQLNAGSYSLKAFFTPTGTSSSSNANYTYSASNSTPATGFTVTKLSETSTTTLNTVSTPKTFGSEGQTLSGKVAGSVGKPEGTVTVKATGTAITGCTTLSLTAGTGTTATFTCTLGTSALSVGTHSLVATYTPGTPSSSTGNHSYSTSASTGQTLTVNSASVCTSTKTFTLAAGATLDFTAVGGGGGASSLAGGPGANISGTLHNTSGSAKTITYKVGCKGTPGKTSTSSTPPGGAGGGGYAAGGTGGHGHASSPGSMGGGGGGGATDIEIGSTVVVVAGGGGGGSTTAPSLVTTTKTPASPAAGLTGAPKTNSHTDGGGGGGGGDKTRAAGGAANAPGAGGFNFEHANGTVGGITVTITSTVKTGGNAGNPGSVTFYSAPIVTAVYPVYAAVSHTIHMTITGTTFAPGASVSLWTSCAGASADATATSVTWVNSTTLRATVTTAAPASKQCVQVTEGPTVATLNSGHTLSSGNFFTQKSGGVLTALSGTLTILPGNSGTLTLSVTSSQTNACTTGVLATATRALYFGEPTISVGTLSCSGTSSSYTVSGTVTVGAGAFTSPPKITVTLTGGASHTDVVTDETAITVDPPSTPPGTPLTAPTVTGIAPPSGTAAGNTWVTITGTNFRWTAAVSFGGTASPSVIVNSTTSITALSPAHAAGPVAVSVTTINGTTVTSAGDVFTYTTATPPPAPSGPTVTSLTPGTGPGTTTVTITGTNLSTVSSVVFGTVPGTTLTVSPTGTILTVKAPSGTVGTTVTVSLLPVSGTPVPAGKFTYTSAQSSTSSTPPKTSPTGTGTGGAGTPPA